MSDHPCEHPGCADPLTSVTVVPPSHPRALRCRLPTPLDPARRRRGALARLKDYLARLESFQRDHRLGTQRHPSRPSGVIAGLPARRHARALRRPGRTGLCRPAPRAPPPPGPVLNQGRAFRARLCCRGSYGSKGAVEGRSAADGSHAASRARVRHFAGTRPSSPPGRTVGDAERGRRGRQVPAGD
jgi:hypothetical protein